MSSVAPAPIPIRRAEGDFPPDRPTTFTDDYGRSQVLVPIERLQQAETVAKWLVAEWQWRFQRQEAGRFAQVERLAIDRAVAHMRIDELEDRNACSIVDEILGRRDGESSHNAARRVIAERDRAQAVDHTDPDQIRRAAGVIEGLGMDRGVTHPENYWMSPATLRRRAQLAEQ
ncbi:hypothetical protein SEA_CONFIDENCE_59 [Gordonia phage Confidence]|nr:hypothetical protein SEA_CONFIDENCE_59 [Gordonia phage Confidence]